MHRDTRANANISNRLRNAINAVSVTWSAGGKRPSAIMAGCLQPANCDLTWQQIPARDWYPWYLSSAIDDMKTTYIYIDKRI